MVLQANERRFRSCVKAAGVLSLTADLAKIYLGKGSRLTANYPHETPKSERIAWDSRLDLTGEVTRSR